MGVDVFYVHVHPERDDAGAGRALMAGHASEHDHAVAVRQLAMAHRAVWPGLPHPAGEAECLDQPVVGGAGVLVIEVGGHGGIVVVSVVGHGWDRTGTMSTP